MDHATTKYLSKKEVAAFLSVSARQVDRWIAEGRLPRVQLGTRMVRFRPDDVDALVARLVAEHSDDHTRASTVSQLPAGRSTNDAAAIRIETAPSATGPRRRRAG